MKKFLDPLLKNNTMKRVYQTLGLKKPFVKQAKTNHYRCPSVEEKGYVILNEYKGPKIPKEEWENLTYTTYATDPTTLFAPLTSATGKTELRGFWDYGKPDKEGVWTSNAALAPNLVNWVKESGANYGRVQLIKIEKNSLREARWGLHLDDNNRLNPEGTGWVIRMWIELTDDPNSYLVLRDVELDHHTETRIPLPQGTQVVVDSEFMFHGVNHNGDKTRYGLIVSFESTLELEAWIVKNKKK
jgi:hypothetical protein